jgi:uncharacterized protein (TIGR00299 family) protein
VKTLYLESVSGIAGDMFAAAFIHAGLLDPRAAEDVPRRLGLDGARVVVSAVRRAEVAAARVDVVVANPAHADHDHPRAHHDDHHHRHDHHEHTHTHYPALDALLDRSDLEVTAKTFARRVFRLLAEVEARAHGCAIDEVTFHEVGDVDSIVDVALAGLCVSAAAPDRVVASPVRLGRGTVRTRHGMYPVPPPASAYLADGMPVAPTPEDLGDDVELSTPTGLAILKALDPEFASAWPAGRVRAVGFGAGSREFGSRPNVFRVVMLETPGRESGSFAALPFQAGTVVEIECNVDDQTGERSAWLIRRVLALGALDAWMTPIVGKKGRPAHCFTLLAQAPDAPRLADWLLRHSSTFGLRYSTRDKLQLDRTQEVRETPRGPVRFKIGRTTEGETVKEKPEFDDLEKIWEEDPEFLP